MSVSTSFNSAPIHLGTVSAHSQLHSLSRQPLAMSASMSKDDGAHEPSALCSASGSSKNSSKNPSSWDPQDDLLLRHLKEVKKMGWKDISQYFPNRTPNACQFRWRRLKSGNLKSNKTALIDINTYSGPLKITHSNGTAHSQQKPTEGADENALEEGTTVQVATTSCIPIPSRKTSLPSFSASMAFSQSPSNMTPPALPAAHPHQHLHHHPHHKALKPRSNSHSFTNSLNQDPTSRSNDEEKYGFVPKVFVRSRRSSLAVTTTPSSPSSPHVLLSSKSRKDPLANWSRRSSFNVSSGNTSRRSSVILAPNSVSNVFNTSNSSCSNTVSSTNSRRESVIKKEFQQRLNNLGNSGASTPGSGTIFPPSYTFMDLPHTSTASSSSALYKFKRGSFSGHSVQSSSWSKDEDVLLMENEKRNLSLMELSILLPQRTEVEIQWRLNVLSNDTDVLPQGALSRNNRPSMFKSESSTDDDNTREGDDEDNVDPLHHSKESGNKTALSSSSSNISSKDVSPDPIFSPDPADDSSNTSDTGSRLTITSEIGSSNTTTNSKNPQDITLLNNFRSEAINPRSKTSYTTTSITTETTSNTINHSSSTTTTTNNSPLPSINTLFKDML
ncbi:hypothetical protein SKDZ_05G1670 [Saccharomyces kudriavzevii ZP591]|uniref:Dot6p n=1 Tax=Saccharomyces cerevisiae x Saccharomyces kudriavzevii (strain VIN7) TaxID=1095631 RepID=H0GTY8_SACCK|nr:Dot6p [Saccharomyces cerevisiae x Saccharomyces kudriavzevii VIN7]CAI4060451.1 hypothetical protein SKDZ_05G1670 [Saccharomyces kudriavzevii ZP591]